MDTAYLYGHHFAITFITCFILYYKTLKTLKKHEKDFAEELNKLSETSENHSFRKI